MDNLLISQVASLEAPQSEMDKVSKGQAKQQNFEQANQQILLKAFQDSMQEVNELAYSEKNDPLFDKEQEEDPREDESNDD